VRYSVAPQGRPFFNDAKIGLSLLLTNRAVYIHYFYRILFSL